MVHVIRLPNSSSVTAGGLQPSSPDGGHALPGVAAEPPPLAAVAPAPLEVGRRRRGGVRVDRVDEDFGGFPFAEVARKGVRIGWVGHHLLTALQHVGRSDRPVQETSYFRHRAPPRNIG